MFVVRVFDQSTGHTETVSRVFPDLSNNTQEILRRRAAVVDRFAAEDTSTDDLYYSTTWPLEATC